ncbi:acyl-CoA dehydrogenase family protein [Vibrio parahaemolyticus]|nr:MULTISPECIES: acyl-CoA dehydrogenase family protein [Vibrio]EHK0032751.1 acyl-CoA dehydrogenase family protein [Vibrio parahaemolyticus]
MLLPTKTERDFIIMLSPQLDAIRRLVTDTLTEGRALGMQLERHSEHYGATAEYSLAPQLNRLGLAEVFNPTPLELDNGDVLHTLTVEQRCVLYEALAYVDPNLIFACPTPGMAGFVLQAMGNAEQQERFFGRFRDQLSWSCYAMSEPGVGSDAGNIATTATKVDGGYLINGEKYFIGNGFHADIGVVFARTSPGPIGMDVFLVEPAQLKGLTRTRLHSHGVPGSAISHLSFNNVFVDDRALLGAHLKPTQRFSGAAIATFDSLRPCVGGLALGTTRALVEHAEQQGTIARVEHRRWLHKAQRELAGALEGLLVVARKFDQGQSVTQAVGLAKAKAVQTAESVCDALLHRLEPGALASDPLLAKLYRDLKSFEYAEGTRHIHWLNAHTQFREATQ